MFTPSLHPAQQSLFVGEFPAVPKIVNVASVSQRSPFRYPGGKTWLVPEVRDWLSHKTVKPTEFIEIFAGGGIVGLTVAAENLAERASCKTIFETKRNDIWCPNFGIEMFTLPLFAAIFRIYRISSPLRANSFTGQAGLRLFLLPSV